MLTDSIKLKGRVGIVVKDKNGKIKEKREETNLVVDTGLAYIASRMKDTTKTAMSHMALGTGTTGADELDTDLEAIASGFTTREALDSTTVTNNEIKYICNFEAGDVASSGTTPITEAGIFNNATPGSGDMLCRVVFSQVNLETTDSISVEWTVTIQAS